MKVSFVRPDLHHLDEVAAQAVAFGVFEDERPLRGLGGLVDWRLNGALSRWITAQRFRGAVGERLLYPDRGRLTFGRVLVCGLGPRSEWGDDTWQAANVSLLRTLRELGVTRFAVAPPGRDALVVNVRQSTEQWLGFLRDVFLDEPPQPARPEVLLVETAETVRVIGDTVQSFVRRLARNRGWA